MKKIYLSLAGWALFSVAIGQISNERLDNDQKFRIQTPYQRMKQPVSSPPADNSRSTDFKYWVDPVVDMMYNKGLELEDPAKSVQGLFVTSLLMDSSMNFTSTKSSEAVYNMFLGNLMDLKSEFLKPADNGKPSAGAIGPIINPTDPYKVDSISIWGSYVRADGKKTIDDTLYIWLVWGDSLDATVFTKRKSTDLWPLPLSNWRYNSWGPTIKGTLGVDGNVVSPTAASPSNVMLIKRVLKATDTTKVTTAGSTIKEFRAFAGASIPAGNVVSCFYTYVPQAGSYTKGDVTFSLNTAVKPTSNGFAAVIWDQILPKVTAASDYLDHQVDPTPGCISTAVRLTKNGRYKGATALSGIPVSTPYLNYLISGKSTVGISEFQNQFSLYQNTPNPFNDQTTIAYQLKTPAKNVSLIIYDVAGAKIFDKSQTNLSSGKYTVEVNNTNFASGIYFYSLIVDGHQITKKMIVTE